MWMMLIGVLLLLVYALASMTSSIPVVGGVLSNLLLNQLWFLLPIGIAMVLLSLTKNKKYILIVMGIVLVALFYAGRLAFLGI